MTSENSSRGEKSPSRVVRLKVFNNSSNILRRDYSVPLSAGKYTGIGSLRFVLNASSITLYKFLERVKLIFTSFNCTVVLSTASSS